MNNKILIMLMILASTVIYSQSQYDFVCGTNSGNPPNTPIGMGLAKPMKTPPTNDESKYFRVLIAFVEFANDESGPHNYWEYNSVPTYAYPNQIFASQKILGLTSYESYKVSDYFNKVSRDQFDMIGDIYHVVLSHEYSYYASDRSLAQTEVFTNLDNQIGTGWANYDLWSWNSNTQEYEMSPDNYIDMIYVQYRHVGAWGITYGAEASALVDYTTSTGKYISSAIMSIYGSGITGYNGANMSLDAFVGVFRHEYCHYTLGYHKPYSTIGGGEGTETAFGYELGFAPADMIAVGYDNTINFSGSTSRYTLGDLHSTGDILKIPVVYTGEYFLVSNRQRLVGDGNGKIYDCNMGGDTAMGTPFLQFKDYSKGLYIYHVRNGDEFNYYPDLECADGLWDWSLANYTTTPDWSDEQQLPVFIKTRAGYSDDDPACAVYNETRMSSRDGHSVCDYTNSIGTGYHNKWFSIGKRHVELHQKGIDRIYTNEEQDWCSRETMGDRWDAWKENYNTLFSPYSSPNTNDQNNTNSGIFIMLHGMVGNDAIVDTWKVGEGGWTLNDILSVTPPSKPMVIKIEPVDCNGVHANVKITWEHNREPDMLRNLEFKRYKIYRASSYTDTIPATYIYWDTYDDYTPDDTASYIDYLANYNCSIWQENPDPWHVRYKVSAVDKDNMESVKSDFLEANAHPTNPIRFINPNDIPSVFALKQNYPNPFNPITKIQYDIPQVSQVNIKVYDILGREVATLVNETKQPGYYEVDFNGTNLASGVYFYRIQAGNFANVKKMVLMK